MTDTLTQLMRAIVEFPADDTPRLMYADCLDEIEQRETPRAEFVRKQIEFTRTPKELPPGQLVYSTGGMIVGTTTITTTNPKWTDLEGEVMKLWEANNREWFGFPAIERQIVVACGFVESLTCSAADWLTHAPALHWHPNQREKCPNCDGRGEARFCDAAGDMDDEPCRDCGGNLRGGYNRGSGTRPRPFPVTAQPITTVTLTTAPEYEPMQRIAREVGFDWRPSDETARWVRVLEAKWKGVVFTIPNLISASWGHRPMTPLQDLRTLAESLRAGPRPPSRTIRWTGSAGDRDMNNPANWQGGVAPRVGFDTALFPNAESTYAVTPSPRA